MIVGGTEMRTHLCNERDSNWRHP